MKILQQKYPEAWKAFGYSGFPLLPQAWSQAPPFPQKNTAPAPPPTYPTPTAGG